MELNSGLRITRYDGTDETYYSPRVLLNFKVLNNVKLKSSYGAYQQFIREFPFEYRGVPRTMWVSSGFNNIPVLRSNSWMLGFSGVFEHFQMDIEFYHKYFKGMTEYAVIQPGMGNDNNVPANRQYELFRGDGLTNGLDLTISSGIKNYEFYFHTL